MKRAIVWAGILTSVFTGAQAQTFGLTGEFQISVEGGFSIPLNASESDVIVDNNSSGIDGPAPWAVTPFVGADVLNFGSVASSAYELSADMNSGANVFLRAQGVSGNGETDLSGLWSGFGAVPGTFDDGYLMSSDWEPIATVETRELAVTAGYRSVENAGFTWTAGVTQATVSQNLSVDYDFNINSPDRSSVAGLATNDMYGLTAGLGFKRAITDVWSVSINADAATFQNSYNYVYEYQTEDVFFNSKVSAAGESVVYRTDIAAKISYAVNETTQLSGLVGVTNYSGIVSGLENVLNAENTAVVVTPFTSTVTLPYVRFGFSTTY